MKILKILEGFWYNHIVFFFNPNHYALREVKRRREICKSCFYYDRFGWSKEAKIKGFPACKACGCMIAEKTACISCECGMVEIGKDPKWGPIKTKDEDVAQSYVDGKDKQNARI